jgi:hypothetical protein
MIRNFLKTKIGVSLIIAIIFIISATIFKISLSTPKESELGKQVSIIATESVKKSIQDGSYGFEDALNLLGSSTEATVGLKNITGTTTIIATADTTTATDRFARELFTKYAEAKKNGQAIDSVTQEQIAEMVLSNDYSGQRKLATTEDLNVSGDISASNARTYGNKIGKILSVEPVKGDQELKILQRVQEGGMSQADAATLSLIFKRYQGFSTALKALSVPADAASAHAAVLNGINLLMDGVEGMLTLETDPVGALTKIKFYENGINLVSAGALKLKVYFMSKNITFSPGEGGYKITQ